MDIIKILCAIFIPPLGVFLHSGIGKDFWINLILTLLTFGLLGMIHALWLILKK